MSGFTVSATPDLIVNQFRLEGNVAVQTRTFAATDCAVAEGCATTGTRRLLLFDVGLINVGDGHLIVGVPSEWPNLFHMSACQGQNVFNEAAGYELLTTNGTVVTARKQGFCFWDEAPAMTNAGAQQFTSCDYQGLSIGWEVVSDKTVGCQWLDITGVAAGQYILRVVVNPDAVLHESNFANNSAEVLITLGTPPNTNTNKPKQCVEHDDWNKWWSWKKLKDKFKGHWNRKCKIRNCTCKCHPGNPGHGNGNGDDDDDGKGGGGKGHDDDDDGKGGGGNGKDDDDDGKGGGGKGHDDDDDGKGGGGKGHDDDDDGKGGGGKGHDDDDDGKGKDNGNGHGKGKDDGKGKGKGKGKDDDKCKDDGKGKGKPPVKAKPKSKAKK